jgi:protein involved in polysaccharide export with SLBB domain
LPLSSSLFASYIVRPHDEFRFRDVYTIADAGKVTLQGQVRYPGSYEITTGEHLSDLLIRGGGLTNVAYPYGTIFLRRSVAELEASEDQRAAKEIEDGLLVGMTRQGNSQVSPQTFAALQGFVNQIRNAKPLGRISVIADPSQLLAHPTEDVLLEPGDVIYIPQRPSTVAVLGRVLQPGSFPFRPGLSTADYIRMAGGYAQFADDSETYVVLPDGTARRYRKSWLDFDRPDIPPGSAVVVPRDLAPLDLHQLIVDTTSIVGQLAVSAASLAVLSKQ